MTDQTGPEKDYSSRLSWYISKKGKVGPVSDLAAVLILASTALLLLGISIAGVPPLRLWVGSIALFLLSRGAAQITTPDVHLTKNGGRVEVIKDNATGTTNCDEHDCEEWASHHVRSYEVFYLLGYEVSRTLSENTRYCDEHYGEHYPLDGLAPEEEVEKVIEYERH